MNQVSGSNGSGLGVRVAQTPLTSSAGDFRTEQFKTWPGALRVTGVRQAPGTPESKGSACAFSQSTPTHASSERHVSASVPNPLNARAGHGWSAQELDALTALIGLPVDEALARLEGRDLAATGRLPRSIGQQQALMSLIGAALARNASRDQVRVGRPDRPVSGGTSASLEQLQQGGLIRSECQLIRGGDADAPVDMVISPAFCQVKEATRRSPAFASQLMSLIRSVAAERDPRPSVRQGWLAIVSLVSPTSMRNPAMQILKDLKEGDLEIGVRLIDCASLIEKLSSPEGLRSWLLDEVVDLPSPTVQLLNKRFVVSDTALYLRCLVDSNDSHRVDSDTHEAQGGPASTDEAPPVDPARQAITDQQPITDQPHTHGPATGTRPKVPLPSLLKQWWSSISRVATGVRSWISSVFSVSR